MKLLVHFAAALGPIVPATHHERPTTNDPPLCIPHYTPLVPVSLDLAGEDVRLRSDPALYWPRRRTLYVADVHLGKAATFRAKAVPLPRGTTPENLRRLGAAVDAAGAERLVVLGDLLHAAEGTTERLVEAVAAWRRERDALEVVLVPGNHDRTAGPLPDALGIRVADGPVADGPFVCRHAPEPDDRGYVLAGHRHPAVVLEGRGDRLRLPCFHLTDAVATLPAFGEFTGGATVRPAPADRLYAVADDAVVPV